MINEKDFRFSRFSVNDLFYILDEISQRSDATSSELSRAIEEELRRRGQPIRGSRG